MTETPETQAPADTGVETGQAPEAGQGSQQGSNWYDAFEGEELGYIQNKGWDKEDGLQEFYKSYKNLEKMRGVPEDRLLKLPEGEDGWDEVYKKLGKPENPDGYSFEAKEGMELDQERLDWFSNMAHGLNLNKQQHNKLVEAAYDYESNIIKSYEEGQQQEREIAMNKLKDSWGNAYDERLELGKRAVRAFVDDMDVVDKLSDAIGSDAEVVRMFAKIGESLSEDKLPSVDGDRKFGYSREQAEADIVSLKNEIKSDRERLENFNKAIGSDFEKMQRLRKVVNG